jgi:DNA repair exonuclease SbcCD ATPase subunit
MLMPSVDVNNTDSAFGKSYTELKQLLAQLDDLFTRVEMAEREITDLQHVENIEAVLLKHEGDLEPCIIQELTKYDQKLAQIQPLEQQLDQVMGAIINANQQFVQRSTTDSQRKREQVIQNMYAAINKYAEILANMQEGINFYTTMQDIIKKLSQRVGDFVFARKTEKQDLIANLQHQLSGVPVQPHNPYGSQPPPPQQYGTQPVYQQQPPQYQQQQQKYYQPAPQQSQGYPPQQQLPPPPFQQQRPPQQGYPPQYGVQPQNPYNPNQRR